MMNEEWASILADFNEAKSALWCPKHGGNGWRMDEDRGRYFLWQAYHHAMNSQTKEPLLFARILFMMHTVSRWPVSDYDRYHKYLKPALDAYQTAIASGLKPSEAELERIQVEAGGVGYVLDCQSKSSDIQLSYIHGHEKLCKFWFHDSEPIHFEHTKDTARLSLRYHNTTATFLFEGIVDMQVEGDPLSNWIQDFYCYPTYHNKSLFVFDVGYYRFFCSSISVVDVTETEE